jgi:hypothetical protein
VGVTFTATASDAKRCTVSYTWDFGADGTATGVTVTRSFVTLGHRRLHVTATGCGSTASGASDIWVVAKPCRDGRPFDLFWTTPDPNGLPLDPEWRWQCDYTAPASGSTASGYFDPNSYCRHFSLTPTKAFVVGPGCSSEIQGIDVPTDALWWTICHFITTPPWGLENDNTVHGHVNWRPEAVTYQGTVSLQGVQQDFPSGFGDGDADLNLIPSAASNQQLDSPSPPGVTAENPDHIHVEFHAAEVLQAFPDGSDYADAWANSLTTLPAATDARVVGLVGLDVRHGSYSEVHPVYALALRESAPPGVERWLILARNGGTEGGCSDNTDHPFAPSDGRITMQLPFPGELRKPLTAGSYFYANFVKKPSVTVMRSSVNQVDITITLPPLGRYEVVAGELDLETSSSAALQNLARRPLARSAPTLLLSVPPGLAEPEDVARSLALLLPPSKRTAAFVVRVARPTAPRMNAIEACNYFRRFLNSPEAKAHPAQVQLVLKICENARKRF